MALTVKLSHRVRNLDSLFEFTPAEANAALETFDALVRRHEIELFATQGLSGGTVWPPLSPEYAERKRKRRPGRKILVFDGNLRQSLTTLASSEHVAQSAKVGPGRWILRSGSTNRVGKYHLTGGQYLPVRKPMSFTSEQIANMRRAIANRLLPFVKQRFRALARVV